MYLDGDEDGTVGIICTHEECMEKGRVTPTNPKGLWLRRFWEAYQPKAHEMAEEWDAHLKNPDLHSDVIRG